MGLHPKIGITGLPRSGKSAVMEKVLGMLSDERKREISLRGNHSGKPIIAGLRTEPIIENGERLGYKVIDIITGEEGVIAHKEFDSRLRVLGYGLDLEALERVAIPAIEYAKEEKDFVEEVRDLVEQGMDVRSAVSNVARLLDLDGRNLMRAYTEAYR